MTTYNQVRCSFVYTETQLSGTFEVPRACLKELERADDGSETAKGWRVSAGADDIISHSRQPPAAMCFVLTIYSINSDYITIRITVSYKHASARRYRNCSL